VKFKLQPGRIWALSKLLSLIAGPFGVLYSRWKQYVGGSLGMFLHAQNNSVNSDEI
jgi:hypothetical protein